MEYLLWNIYLVLLAHVSPAQNQAESFHLTTFIM